MQSIPYRVGAIVLLMASVLSPILLAGEAFAQTDTTEIDPGTGGLVLLSRSVQSIETFELGIQLPGVVEDDDLLVVAVHPHVGNRSEFRSSLDGRGLDQPSIVLIFEVGQLDVTLRGGVRLEIDRITLKEDLPDAGVYPVTVELRTAGQERLGRLVTHLVRVSESIPDPTKVALALIMDFAPQETATNDIVSTDTTAQWMDVILGRPDLPVTVQMTPWLLDRYRTDPRMRSFVSRLGDAELIAAPYVPIDERALELAGLGDRGDELFRRGIETLRTEVGLEPITTRWLSLSEPERDTLTLWHRRGVRDAVVSVNSGNFDGPVESITDDGVIGVVATPIWFSDADPDNTVLGAHHLLAELAVIAMTSEHDTSSVLLFGTGQALDRRFMDELIGGLIASVVIEPVSLSEAVAVPQLVNGVGQPIRLVTRETQSDELEGDIQLYLRAVSDLESYRSMIADEDASRVYIPTNDRLLESLGEGISGQDRDAAARQALDEVRVEVNAVEPPPLGGVSLTAREATAPFSFRNNNDYPMRVEVRFISEKARFVDFDDGETTTILLEPGVTTKEFRVQALSAGSFPLRIEIFSPDGALELGAVDLTMRSTVPSFLGVAVTIGAAFFLVLWWGRDLLRSRRSVAA